MGTLTMKDDTRIAYKDWARGSRWPSATAGRSPPISGIAMGALFASFLPLSFVPPAVMLALPWSLSKSAVGLALGTELPDLWPIPVLATMLWMVLSLGVALWQFGHEEF